MKYTDLKTKYVYYTLNFYENHLLLCTIFNKIMAI